MVVVVLIAGGAALCLKLFWSAQAAGTEVFERIIFSIRQQAGVMAALSATVFAVLTALTTGKATSIAGAAASSTPNPWASKVAPAVTP